MLKKLNTNLCLIFCSLLFGLLLFSFSLQQSYANGICDDTVRIQTDKQTYQVNEKVWIWANYCMSWDGIVEIVIAGTNEKTNCELTFGGYKNLDEDFEPETRDLLPPKWWATTNFTTNCIGIDRTNFPVNLQINPVNAFGFGHYITVEEKFFIPDWQKNPAKWWAEGLISDQEYINGIEFLIKNDIIIIKNMPDYLIMENTPKEIPVQMKDSAKLWAEGRIFYDEIYAAGIKHLTQIGVIQVR